MFIVAVVSMLVAIAAGIVWSIRRRSVGSSLFDENPPKQEDFPEGHFGAFTDAERRWKQRRDDHAREQDNARFIVRIALICMIASASIGGILLIGSSAKIVPTKQVGVVTSFGKPTGVLSNGLHFVWPWEKVTQLDAAIQTDNNVGQDATTIRLGNQSTAGVENSIRWRIQPDQADALFRDYRDFDKIRDSLVTRELKAALNQVFKDYDPLSTVKGAVDGSQKQASITDLGNQVTEDLRKRIGDDIEVLNVIIPLVRFDDETQGRINAFQSEIANTRIAEQRERTAKRAAAANRALSGSVSHDPNVLVSKCLDALENMIKEGQSVPAGFSCWPGGGSAVVLPAARK